MSHKVHEVDGYILTCQDCGGTDVMRNGINAQGNYQVHCRPCNTYKTARLIDKELLESALKSDAKNQKHLDQRRIDKKGSREHYRLHNAVSEYAQELIKIYKRHGIQINKLNISPLKRKSKKMSGTGILHCTDWHGNELIDEPGNKFDFPILAKRAKIFAQRFIDKCKQENVSKVVIALGGDMLNSDRRLDEKLNMATNRAKATILMQLIVFQMILHIREELKLPIKLVSVLGNEGRMDQEMAFSSEVLSNNYDFLIAAGVWQMIKCSDVKGIDLVSVHKVKEVMNVEGLNILLVHNFGKSLDNQKNVQALIGQYIREHDVKIDYAIGGHIHDTFITSISARAGSIAGGNAFSFNALGYASRASQNFFIVRDGKVIPEVVDLQGVEYKKELDGYNIVEELEAYNAKSVSKLTKGKVSLQVVII